MKWLACCTLALAMIAMGTQVARAQDYREIAVTATDIDPDATDLQGKLRYQQARANVIEYLRSKPMDEQGRQLIRKFFRDAYLKSWTKRSNWQHAGANRQEFLRLYYGSLNSQPNARQMLNEIVLEYMREYIKPAYHPVLRYNAALLIGDLRSKEMDSISQTPEVPYPESLPVLLEAIADEKQSDAVKVAAWVGLLEQSELYGVNLGSMPNDLKTKIITLVINTLQQNEVPEGHSEDAHLWIRKRAIDVASTIGNAGKNGALAAALDSIILNPNLPIDMRCSAIAAKGNLAFDNETANQMDVVRQSTDIGKIALEAVAADVTWFDESLKEYQKKMFGAGGGYGGEYGGYGEGGMGGYAPVPTPTASSKSSSSRSRRGRGRGRGEMDMYEGGMEMETTTPEIIRDPVLVRLENNYRRRVKTHLDFAKQGLAGHITQVPDDASQIRTGLIQYAKDAEDRKAIANLTKSMIAMLNAVDNKDSEEKDLLKASKTRLESMTTAAQKLAAKAAVEIDVPDAINDTPEDGPGSMPAPGRRAAPPVVDGPGGAMPVDGPGGMPADDPSGAPPVADAPGGTPPADVPDGPGAGPMPMPMPQPGAAAPPAQDGPIPDSP
ncbi:hypothetical protein [Blastopirellula marina]|uniref:HEAT repeat domain-containing protein n=1 Tax=Blastopirellula marina TaxID=124 RepID=A0A2S8GB75_9BACT|nr:hypothetical protein [Blastopirellula marina]PQO41705.1 hypothetical protein C5Y98_03005 [Blastopirellula marina]PTL46148.1 hypothetical protein C5Y97_03005 [Blastopirellula marina]